MLIKVLSFDPSSGFFSRLGVDSLGVAAPDLSREPGREVEGVAFAEAALDEEAADMVVNGLREQV